MAFCLASCAGGNKSAGTGENIPAVTTQALADNQLTPEEIAGGWVLLFDGKTTHGWRGAHKEAFPQHSWKVEGGELAVLASGGSESTNGGDIVTVGEYSAFELSVDFKLSAGANSGIKYFVTEKEKPSG